jgi:hypothetical protein
MQHSRGVHLGLLLGLRLSKHAAVPLVWLPTCLARLVRAALRDSTASLPLGGATSTPLVSILQAGRARCQGHIYLSIKSVEDLFRHNTAQHREHRAMAPT